MRMEVDSGSPLTPPPPPPAAHSNHAAAGSPPSGAEADANSSSSSNNNNNNNRKVVHNASSKVSLVVQRMLLPIIQTPLRSHVVFDVEEDQVELDLIEQLGKKNPGVLEDQTGLTFIQHLQGLFDRYKWWRSPSGAYSRVAVYPSGSRRRRMVVEEPSSSPSFVQSS